MDATIFLVPYLEFSVLNFFIDDVLHAFLIFRKSYSRSGVRSGMKYI